MSYIDFLNFKDASQSFKVAGGVGTFKIKNLKTVRFVKGLNDVFFRYQYEEDEEVKAAIIFKKTSENPKEPEIKAAYSSELPINKKKFDNLKTMCENNIIPPEYHEQYLTLKSNTNVPDVLDDTDVEDI